MLKFKKFYLLITLFFIFFQNLIAETIQERNFVEFGQIKRGQVNSTVSLPAQNNPIPIITPIINGAVYSSGAQCGKIRIRQGTPGTTIHTISLYNYSTLNNGNKTISITSMTHNNLDESLVFNANGVMNIKVGADIIITSNQQKGIYTGTYDFSFYNSNNTFFSITGLTLTIEIIQGNLPISITESRTLRFGEVSPGNLASTIEITQNSNQANVISGNAFAFSTSGTPASRRGTMLITADPNSNVNISFSSGDVLIGSGTSISLYNLVHNGGANPILIDPTGSLSLRIGGRIDIAANQQEGSYSGSYTVIVDYQ